MTTENRTKPRAAWIGLGANLSSRIGGPKETLAAARAGAASRPDDRRGGSQGGRNDLDGGQRGDDLCGEGLSQGLPPQVAGAGQVHQRFGAGGVHVDDVFEVQHERARGQVVFHVLQHFGGAEKQRAIQPPNLQLPFVPGQARGGGGVQLFGAREAGDAVDEGQARGGNAEFNGHRQIKHHGEQEDGQQRHAVGHAVAAQADELAPLAHVPGHEHENGRQRGQRNGRSQRRGHEDDGQQRQRVHHACHGAGGAAFHICDGAGNRAGGGHAAEKGRDEVGDALRHQLLIGVVAVVNHAVGHARAQQRFDGAQQRQRDGGHEHVARRAPAEIRQREGGQRRRYAAKAGADGFHRQIKSGHRRRGQRQRHDGAGHAGELAAKGQDGADDGHARRFEPAAAVLPKHDDGQRSRRHCQRPAVESVQMRPQRADDAEKVARHLGDAQAQKVLDLRQRHQHRDAVGKADDDGHRDEAHQRAQPQQPHQEQKNARHGRGDDEVAHAVALHDAIDDDDERPRRSANLHPAAAQRRRRGQPTHGRGVM